jgi:catechol 2,3-dioxygenase-like lactoylglutathione lyase family enzyme
MKRFHVHVAVDDLQQSIRFYSQLFAAEPSVVKTDYAKWMLDDPRINFAISHRGGAAGINHLGFQVENNAELEEVHARLEKADGAIVAEEGIACCYAKSDKYWITDPQGIAWESFHSLGTVPFYNAAEANPSSEATEQAACCSPEPVAVAMPSLKSKATSCCAPTTAKTEGDACCN